MAAKMLSLENAIKEEEEAYRQYTKWSGDVMSLYQKTKKHEDLRTATILSEIASEELKHKLWLQNILYRMKQRY